MALITPEYLQTKTYSALRDRLALQHGGAVQEGVLGATDLKISQHAGSANMSVDAAAGFALVLGDDPGNGGLYHIQNDAVVNVTGFSSAHASLPRIDQVYLQIKDTTHGGDSSDVPAFGIATGSATSGATLDNRTGAAATIPTGSIRLCDILIPAASSSITTANIRDRRPWGLGAFYSAYDSTASYSNTSLYVTSGYFPVPALQFRIECSGVPVQVSFEQHGSYVYLAGGPTYDVFSGFYADGSALFETARIRDTTTNTAQQAPFFWNYIWTPTAGSHLVAPFFRSDNASVASQVQGGFRFTVRELPIPFANNS